MNKHAQNPVRSTNNGTVLIVNPSSSGGSTGKNWDAFYIKLKEFFGENPEIVFTSKSGDGSALAREYLKKGFKNIVAIGGDGTINEVINGFFLFNEDDSKESAAKTARDVGSGGGINTTDDISHNTSIPATNSVIAEPPTLRKINPDAVFGIVSSGTR